MFEIKTKLKFKNVWDLKKKIKEENGGKTFSLSNLKNQKHFKSIKQSANESFYKESHRSFKNSSPRR